MLVSHVCVYMFEYTHLYRNRVFGFLGVGFNRTIPQEVFVGSLGAHLALFWHWLRFPQAKHRNLNAAVGASHVTYMLPNR